MKKEKTIDVLNKLVQINNGRVKGYEQASDNTEDKEFEDLFISFKQSSVQCLAELEIEINALGGELAKGTTTSGKFLRAWRDFESAIAGKDRKGILSSCEKCEEIADEAYQKVLKTDAEHLSAEQQSMIKEQHELLKGDRKKINTLQSAVEGAEA